MMGFFDKLGQNAPDRSVMGVLLYKKASPSGEAVTEGD